MVFDCITCCLRLGTPPPPKIPKYNAQQALKLLQDEETEERMEDDEEVPCSVEE